MANRISFSALVSVLVLALAIPAFFRGTADAGAQTAGPDEAVKPDSAVNAVCSRPVLGWAIRAG